MSDQKKRSAAQYGRLAPLLPPLSNHLKISHHQVLDAWLYVLCWGCTWRGLPRQFGNWHPASTAGPRRACWTGGGRTAARSVGRGGRGYAGPGQHDRQVPRAWNRGAEEEGRLVIGRSRSLRPA